MEPLNSRNPHIIRQFRLDPLSFQLITPPPYTTLQSIMNARLSQHRFWHRLENGLIKTIETIPHNLYVLTFILILSKGKST